MTRVLIFVFLSATGALACQPSGSAQAAGEHAASREAMVPSVASYSGTDARGIPRYFKDSLTPEARSLLRRAYGVLLPSHLYVSDSTREGLLKYDPDRKRCATCYVNSYRIGFVSIRLPGESWEDLQRRLRSLRRRSLPHASLISSRTLSAMDPDVQGEAIQMIDSARRAGFSIHILNTYRSPAQEAMLMREGGSRTHTLTSLHSYGRAIDVVVDDGNLGKASTRRDWIAFRRWVIRFRKDDFRILGAPDHSWDWAHVELPSSRVGFHSVDAAVKAARRCLSGSNRPCDFQPHLPGR